LITNHREPGLEGALTLIGALLQHMQKRLLNQVLGQRTVTTGETIEIAE